MTVSEQNFVLSSEAETAQLARKFADFLRPGDCLLLSGEIGAGKSFFSRSLVQSVLHVPEDVPSPTFTLVQTYETRLGELWHCDLYRLTGLDEIDELGLFEVFESVISLIEWPDKLGDFAPRNALNLRFIADATNANLRSLTCTWTDARWDKRMKAVIS